MLKCGKSFQNNLNESLKASDIESSHWEFESCFKWFDSQLNL